MPLRRALHEMVSQNRFFFLLQSIDILSENIILKFQSRTPNTLGDTVLRIHSRSAMQAKNLKSYKHPPHVIPPDVEKHIRPIYKDLFKDDLLIKCLGRHTQNANESFNSTVWRLCPKNLHSGK